LGLSSRIGYSLAERENEQPGGGLSKTIPITFCPVYVEIVPQKQGFRIFN
jgi:hypothetical protein